MTDPPLVSLPPILAAGIGIFLLLLLILRFKLNSFISLLVASIVVALLAGMPLTEINHSIQNGMGGILGFIATIIGLGSIFGKLLEHGGGTEALARRLIQSFGIERAPWAMMLTGFLISIPVFFDAGLVILIPVIYALTRRSGKPILYFGIPLLAGMTVTHSFVPPTPGPIAVAELLDADLGWVILVGIIVGLPTAVIAGPIFGKWISSRITVGIPAIMDEGNYMLQEKADSELPSFASVLLLIGFPIILILSSSICGTLIKTSSIEESMLTSVLLFLGHPFTALILATLATLIYMSAKRGIGKDELSEVCVSALAPAGLIILITGAGGVFKQILIDTHAAGDLAQILQDSNLPLLLLAYLLAFVVRIVQGSATVAMITAASILAPIITEMGLLPGELDKALWTLAIAAGSITFSHVNDSGFWLVSRYFGLTEKQTFQSWSLMTTLVSITGFLIILVVRIIV